MILLLNSGKDHGPWIMMSYKYSGILYILILPSFQDDLLAVEEQVSMH